MEHAIAPRGSPRLRDQGQKKQEERSLGDRQAASPAAQEPVGENIGQTSVFTRRSTIEKISAQPQRSRLPQTAE